jgi:hypothetical protein
VDHWCLQGLYLATVCIMAGRQYFSELDKSVLTELVNQHKDIWKARKLILDLLNKTLICGMF